MRKVVLTYGIIAGVIIALLMVISGSLASGFEENSYSMVVGYATMIISLSMTFFAIKSYRDNQSGGAITFGKGVLIGLYVSLIASVFYVVGWEIYSSIAMPNWVDHYAQHAVDALKKSGASDAAILQKTKEMADFKEMYKNPLYNYGMTFLEIFPVGIVISLISAAFLRRKVASGQRAVA
ncbi:MAG: DUF4199 domain-containing protein [Bacteroidota bacterium]|nr:DUF4199 domain-containing protein [Bacteroidota bacterium]MDP4234785.1 DUF4199 domain-containing protein [Bacteroidota bacterium]MDP4244135.1 DUF4199 domain-containing protein [Bacteroidota bacterium]MDP4289309.1 DUF4199 domain-containing protein [Bacteroidota bacterium]